MKIIVKVKTRAKQEKVERISQPSLGLFSEKKDSVIYKVSVKELPIAGKANEAVCLALAKYFAVPVSRIRLVIGQTSKQKVFEIL